ncbi:hypothetical protein FBEOM_12878 [Fusarium beomiforme]|uniref:Uncharacterized protein n=1 Tax=Fusarium beomiforme TaxID=44412 RepID=A0A9P5A8B7_9HYPO|nr:hypothetical protein FBEOM_12878 [Fusarium beomiforme]
MYLPIVPAPPSAPSQPSPLPDLRSRQNTIANAKGKRRALTRRSASLEFLDKQWNGPDWLPPDVRAGLASVNLSEPADAEAGGALRVAVEQDLELKTKHLPPEAERPEPHLTVASARAVLKRLRATRLDRSRAVSLESAAEFGNSLDVPDNDTEVPGSPVSSIEVFRDARTISSPVLSTASALMGAAMSHDYNTTDAAMTDTKTSSRQSTDCPPQSIGTNIPTEDPLSKLTWNR